MKILLTLVLLLATAGAGAQTRPADLQGILRESVTWRVADALTTWDRPLAKVDVEQLELYIASHGKDYWPATTAAKRLLRKHDPNRHPVSQSVAQAEAILLKTRYGKVQLDANDDLAGELAQLGQDVVPFLETLTTVEATNSQVLRRLAVLGLSGIPHPAATAALWSAMNRPLDGYTFSLVATELLKKDGTEESVGRVVSAMTKRGAFDQETVLRAIGKLPTETRLRVYAHYSSFADYGQHAVIRGLREIDEPVAFEKLKQIVESHDKAFGVAVLHLSQMSAGDPESALVKALDVAREMEVDDVVFALHRRGGRSAIPRLREIQKTIQDPRIACVVAAGLASFGDAYPENAALVHRAIRDAKPDDSWHVLESAALLSDAETVRLVCQIIDQRRDDMRHAIEVTGKIGSPLALTTLRKLAIVLPALDTTDRFPTYSDIGRAAAAIGEQMDDDLVREEAKALLHIPDVLGLEIGQRQQADTTDSRHEHENAPAAEYLRRNPTIVVNRLKRLAKFGRNEGSLYPTLAIVEKTWTEAYVAPLEEILRVNVDTSAIYDNGRVVSTVYHTRKQIAALLSKMTGKPHSFVDADGTTRSAE